LKTAALEMDRLRIPRWNIWNILSKMIPKGALTRVAEKLSNKAGFCPL
jgi:hypothetical protein